MIHVCYGMRDESGKYSKFVGTSMVSIFENTGEDVTIHILHDSTLSQENRNRLIFTAMDYDQTIEFYDVEKLVPDCHESILKFVPRVRNHWAGLAGFYRMLIPDLLSLEIKRAIYLDVDTIVNLDISDLWRIDLESKPLGAVAESESNMPRETTMQICVPCQMNIIAPEDYFNSGLLLFDLNKTRKFFLTRGGGGNNLFESCLLIHQQYPNLRFLNQDPLNILFAQDFLKLPGRFNHLVSLAMTYEKIEEVSREIYHFNGLTLNMDMGDPWTRLYIKYLVKTKFFDHKSLEHVCRRFSHFVERWQKIAWASANRKREFFITPPMFDLISRAFNLTSEDIVVNAQSPDLGKIIHDDILKRDRVMFFMLPDDIYESIRGQLETLGFTEDRDFFSVTELVFQNPLIHVQNRIIRDM